MSTPDLLRCALPAADEALAERARKPFVQDMARQCLAHLREKPTHAAPRASQWFRRNRRLGSKDRPAVQALVYGLVRHEAFLHRLGAEGDAEALEALPRLFAGESFSELAAEGPEADLACALSLPREITDPWLSELGAEEAAALGAALGERAPVTVRANRLKCTREELVRALGREGVDTREVADLPDALDVIGRHELHRLETFRDGWFEVQDASSQRFCEAIPLQPFHRVLDLCAGAGGKSLALAARGVRVRAHDVRRHALQELEERAWRAGAGVRVGRPAPADVVVVDAPCSGSGRLRRDPFVRWRLDPEAWVDPQRQLIEEGGDLVVPGGILAYATCSLVHLENRHPPPEAGRWELLSERTCWPHRDHGDGFAWRIWRRLA